MPIFEVEVSETRRRIHRITANDAAAAENAALFGRIGAVTQHHTIVEDEAMAEQVRSVTEVPATPRQLT